MKVEIYSDVACPWCYVGKRRFERALAAFPGGSDVEVVYRPYQLDPAAPAEASPLEDALARTFGRAALPGMHARLAEVGEGEGIAFAFDRALHVNTLDAHRLLWLALQEYGPDTQAALKDRLLRAYFSEGGDVGDAAELADLAAEAGLDRERAAAFLAGGEGLAETRAEIAHAQAIGVSAVPTFVFEGTRAVQGAQEASAFLQVLEQVARESAEARTPAADGGDACADGACAL